MSELIRGFTATGDRYEIDGALNSSNGWFQVDTWQDAPYFGVWVNPFKRLIFTHCEGDRTLERCSDDDDFKAALNNCLTFYDRDDRPTKVDCIYASRSQPAILERFTALGFAGRCH